MALRALARQAEDRGHSAEGEDQRTRRGPAGSGAASSGQGAEGGGELQADNRGKRAEIEIQQPVVRIGVIKDSAFQFYYPENIEALADAGAEIVFISPLIDQELPELDALYIGGGFPETHARQLAGNKKFNAQLKALADEGFPIYAECGGLMYLGEQLVLEGQSHPMVGILPVTFDFYKRPQGHGYTIVRVVAENPYYEVGTEIRGHEFHYSRVSQLKHANCDLVFRMQRGEGMEKDRDGILYKNVLATYMHVHARGTPQWARALVRNAIRFRKNRTDCPLRIAENQIRSDALAIISSSPAKVTPSALAQTLSEKYRLTGKQIKAILRNLVSDGELAYTYQYGSTYLELSFNRPRKVSQFVVLHPPGHSFRPAPDEVAVQIQAGASFGDGRHPTTRLAHPGNRDGAAAAGRRRQFFLRRGSGCGLRLGGAGDRSGVSGGSIRAWHRYRCLRSGGSPPQCSVEWAGGAD